MNAIKIRDDFHWVGVIDRDLDVFDIEMHTEFGSTYNSYLLKTSEGFVLFETVKVYKEKNKYPSVDLYLKHLNQICKDLRQIKYIVLNHTEPDHTGAVAEILKHLSPNCKIITNEIAAQYLDEIFNKKFNYKIVKEGDILKIGNKTLEFFDIPMLHWPDSMFTLIQEDKIAVTCDTLGSHYAFDKIMISKMDKKELNTTYKKAYKDYYKFVMAPYKTFILIAMQKFGKLFDENKIDIIATGHGPLLDKKEVIKKGIDFYREWSTRKNINTKKLITMVTCSAYGYTDEIATIIKDTINKETKNEYEIKVYKVDAKTYPLLKEKIIHDIIFSDAIMVGSPTLNNDSVPIMWNLFSSFTPIELANKFACVFGSYGWSGEAVKNLTQRLHQLRLRTTQGLLIRFRVSSEEKKRTIKYTKQFITYLKTRKAPEGFIFKNESIRKTIWK